MVMTKRNIAGIVFRIIFFMLMNGSQSKSTSHYQMFLSIDVDTNIVIVNFIVIILGVNKRKKNEKISLGSYLS